MGYDNGEATIENCYNIGQINGSTFGGGIIGQCIYREEDNEGMNLKNNYALTNICGNEDYKSMTNCEVVTEEEMKSSNMITKLNTDITTSYRYVQDTTNINNGYPVLEWQV